MPLKSASVILCVILTLTGLFLARHKPLWIDEIYGQTATVQGASYGQILLGQGKEGNNHPFFYLTQRLLCDALRYRFVDADGEKRVYDEQAQIILRIVPSVSMSLAAAAVFYFFARLYGLWTGIVAFLFFFPSFMPVGYWAEARAYALWFFLTTLQCLGLVRLVEEQGEEEKRLWRWQGIIHVLLAFTSVFGIVQSLVVSALLWLSGAARRPLRRYIWMVAVPVAIGVFYHWHAPFCVFWVPVPWTGLISSNISADRFVFLALYAAFVFCYAPWRRVAARSGLEYLFMYLVCLLMIALTIIGFYKSLHAPHADSFEMPARYFINLACVGNLTAAFIAARLLKEFRGNRWMTVNICIIILMFILSEIFRAYTMLWATYAW